MMGKLLTKYILNRNPRRFLVGLALVSLVWVGGNGVLGQSSAEKKEKVQPSASTEEEVEAEEEFPKSVFTNEIGKGRDPFFPDSQRRQIKITSPKKNTKEVNNGGPVVDSTKPDLSLFEVKGIIGGSIALINGRTFEKGESAKVKTKNGEIEIDCIEVTRDSVEVQIMGYSGRHKLYLGGIK